VSGGTLSATAVNSLNVSGTAISGTGALTIDANTTNTVSIGGISTGDILLGGGSGSTGCTVTNASGNFACTGTVSGTQLISTVATGTAPLTVASTTKVTNLNADLLDGLDSTAFAAATGSAGYIQNTTITQTSANLNIQSAATGSVTAVIKQLGSQTADLLQLQNSAGTGALSQFNANGDLIIGGTYSANSATALKVQNASAGVILNVSTSTGDVVIGEGANTVTINASSGITAAGTARKTKSIVLYPEFGNSVLYGDATNNTGTMTSGYDSTNRRNFYKWTTSQVTNQDYDVVLQVPLPADFGAWNATNPVSVDTYTTNTTNGTLSIGILGTNGGATGCTVGTTMVTPSTTSTWETKTPSCTSSGTYTAGGYITVSIRMQSGTSGDTRLGQINLSYYSNF
jgi:hypothetical protein